MILQTTWTESRLILELKTLIGAKTVHLAELGGIFLSKFKLKMNEVLKNSKFKGKILDFLRSHPAIFILFRHKKGLYSVKLSETGIS